MDPAATDPTAYFAFNQGYAWWVFTWGIWPVFGIVSGVYCFARLLE